MDLRDDGLRGGDTVGRFVLVSGSKKSSTRPPELVLQFLGDCSFEVAFGRREPHTHLTHTHSQRRSHVYGLRAGEVWEDYTGPLPDRLSMRGPDWERTGGHGRV